MTGKNVYLLLITYCILSSCATIQNSAKYDLADGKYQLKLAGKKYNCYLENNADTIKIYKPNNTISTDLPQKSENLPSFSQSLVKKSLDIDILTALFKIRHNTESLPAQLNTNFNGNIYIGHRTDIYQINYKKNPINDYERQLNHFGFSGGLFAGISNTAITTSTTNNINLTEYDGVIFQKGIAGIVAINKLTIGLGLGFDNLLSNKKKIWIYESKPWYGLMLGLNLN